MNSRDYSAKRVVLRKLAKTFCGKKIQLGSDLVGPTEHRRGLGSLTMGLSPAGWSSGRLVRWALAPNVAQARRRQAVWRWAGSTAGEAGPCERSRGAMRSTDVGEALVSLATEAAPSSSSRQEEE